MALIRKKAETSRSATVTGVVVYGPGLVPEDIIEEDLLTPEDYREIALDHISRTSDFVFQLKITKRA